jgi:hypothetical protein
MNTIRLLVVALFFASLVSSCDSSKTSPSTPTTMAGEDSVFFTVDGIAYKFKIYNKDKVADSNYKFFAVDSALDKFLSLDFVHTATGTFSTKGSTLSMVFGINDVSLSMYYVYPHTQDSVTFVITELTPHFKATFNGTLKGSIVNQSGPPTLTLTNGSINAKIK